MGAASRPAQVRQGYRQLAADVSGGRAWPGHSPRTPLRGSLLAEVRPNFVAKQAPEQEGGQRREEDRVREQAGREEVEDERQGQARETERQARAACFRCSTSVVVKIV